MCVSRGGSFTSRVGLVPIFVRRVYVCDSRFGAKNFRSCSRLFVRLLRGKRKSKNKMGHAKSALGWFSLFLCVCVCVNRGGPSMISALHAQQKVVKNDKIPIIIMANPGLVILWLNNSHKWLHLRHLWLFFNLKWLEASHKSSHKNDFPRVCSDYDWILVIFDWNPVIYDWNQVIYDYTVNNLNPKIKCFTLKFAVCVRHLISTWLAYSI